MAAAECAHRGKAHPKSAMDMSLTLYSNPLVEVSDLIVSWEPMVSVFEMGVGWVDGKKTEDLAPHLLEAKTPSKTHTCSCT